MVYTDKLSEQLGPNTEINREKIINEQNVYVSYDGANGKRFNNHSYKTLKQHSLAELLFVITNWLVSKAPDVGFVFHLNRPFLQKRKRKKGRKKKREIKRRESQCCLKNFGQMSFARTML